jgi:hypothetical protein
MVTSLDGIPIFENPSVSGSRNFGSTLTANPGLWQGTPTFTYRWLRCDAPVNRAVSTPPGCSIISGQTGQTYTISQADAGKFVIVDVTASNQLGTARITSAESEPVRQPPINTNAPTITVPNSSIPELGVFLSAASGTWQGFPEPEHEYQWFVCASKVVSPSSALASGCNVLASSTSSNLRLSDTSLLGKYALVRVVGRNALGSSIH